MPKPLVLVRTDTTDDALPIPVGKDAAAVLAEAAEKMESGTDGVLATVLERHGSAPGTPGQKLYLGGDRSCVGTVGGGALEKAILRAMEDKLAALASGVDGGSEVPLPEVRTFKLGAELGMCCGGRVTALIEPLVARVPCFVVGAGHVATATAPILASLGFAVTVCDARDAWGDDRGLPGVRCESGDYDAIGRDFPVRSALLVMTHDHALDQEVLEWGLRRGFAFVGGVGSRAKAERTKARLEAKGFPEVDRARVRMPLGVTIGARLPAEIAVSIAAELVQWRRGASR